VSQYTQQIMGFLRAKRKMKWIAEKLGIPINEVHSVMSQASARKKKFEDPTPEEIEERKRELRGIVNADLD
jgi:hypothetical protein